MIEEGTLTDIRTKARAIIDKNVPPKARYTSDGAKDEFTRLTGGRGSDWKPEWKWRHDKLMAVWAAGSQETCCMDFVGWYARQLAAALSFDLKGENLGRFDINTVIKNKSAWINTNGVSKPKYGDVLLHAGIHIDVAIGFEDGHLWRVAAGQGTVGTRDIITRVKGDGRYNYQRLKGWVDIDVYFGGSVAPCPIPTRMVTPPDWVFGWWRVNWRGDEYRYFFYRDGTVEWTEHLQQSTSRPPLLTDGTGTFVFDALGKIIIQWESGSVETFSKAGSTREMRGTWTGRDGSQAQLTASKLETSFIA